MDKNELMGSGLGLGSPGLGLHQLGVERVEGDVDDALGGRSILDRGRVAPLQQLRVVAEHSQGVSGLETADQLVLHQPKGNLVVTEEPDQPPGQSDAARHVLPLAIDAADHLVDLLGGCPLIDQRLSDRLLGLDRRLVAVLVVGLGTRSRLGLHAIPLSV